MACSGPGEGAVTFNVLSDPVPDAFCACGGRLFIVGRWSATSYYLQCEKCRLAALHELEFKPAAPVREER